MQKAAAHLLSRCGMDWRFAGMLQKLLLRTLLRPNPLTDCSRVFCNHEARAVAVPTAQTRPPARIAASRPRRTEFRFVSEPKWQTIAKNG